MWELEKSGITLNTDGGTGGTVGGIFRDANGDSMNAIRMINGNSKPPNDLEETVNSINELSQGYKFKHVYREANQVADYLASLGNEKGIQVFNGNVTKAFNRISAFTGRPGDTDVTGIELDAIVQGITIAQKLKIEPLNIQSDSLNAIRMIKNKCNVLSAIVNMVQWIRIFFHQGYIFNHIKREANQVADLLASLPEPRLGIQRYNAPWSIHMYSFRAAKMIELLAEDRDGKVYTKNRNTKLSKYKSTNSY